MQGQTDKITHTSSLLRSLYLRCEQRCEHRIFFESLLSAVCEGEYISDIVERIATIINQMLRSDIDLNSISKEGYTILHFLVEKYMEYKPKGTLRSGRMLGLISKCLKNGADPFIRDINGCTPLLYSLEKNLNDVVGYMMLYSKRMIGLSASYPHIIRLHSAVKYSLGKGRTVMPRTSTHDILEWQYYFTIVMKVVNSIYHYNREIIDHDKYSMCSSQKEKENPHIFAPGELVNVLSDKVLECIFPLHILENFKSYDPRKETGKKKSKRKPSK